MLQASLNANNFDLFEKILNKINVNQSATTNALIIANHIINGRGKSAEDHWTSFFEKHTLPYPSDITEGLQTYICHF
jgi:hypothetical protein